jgi:hypothetical protein
MSGGSMAAPFDVAVFRVTAKKACLEARSAS